MAWIESHQKLEKSGKLLRLAEILEINRYQAIGHLHAFWWWALDNAEDGDVTRFSPVTVAQVCGWADFLKDERDLSRLNEYTHKDFSNEDFYNALIESGLLDREENKVTIHNWDEYTHRYFSMIENNRRNRENTRQRVRAFRERNATVTPIGNATVTPSNAPTVPNQTKPNQQTPPKAAAPSAWFDQIWPQYPRRESKKAAIRHFNASVKTMQDWLDIQNALANFKKKLVRENTEPQYIPHGGTWFNNWRDYVSYQGVDPVRAPAVPVKTRPVEKELTDEERAEGARVMAEAKEKLRSAGHVR